MLFIPPIILNIINPYEFNKFQIVFVLLGIIIYSPISYFVPVIFTKVKKLKQVVIINMLIINFIYIINLFSTWNEFDSLPHGTIMFIRITSIIYPIILSIFSGILGYKILNIMSNKTSGIKELVRK